jgi:Tol biopolymer transport system component
MIPARTTRSAAPAIRPAAATATLSQLRYVSQAALLAAFGIMLCQPALAVSTDRVSVASNGTEVSDGSDWASISADGRFIAFISEADDLVAGDSNGQQDVFVHDRQTGTTERANVASNGSQATGGSSDGPSISPDGRFVVFASMADNLVAGDTNAANDVFVRDRLTGTTERVSVTSGGVEGNDQSRRPSISADGRFVAFSSDATNLVAGDSNGLWDAFVHDRQTGTTERVSVDSGGAQATGDDSTNPSISADGRFVAFDSGAVNLVAGDSNAAFDVFVHDRQTGTTERVSVDTTGAEATPAGDGSLNPSISADGRFVAFRSDASDLTLIDTNGTVDVFVHDRQTGVTQRISIDSIGNEGNGISAQPSISADGRFVAFYSSSNNLIPSDTNADTDIFVHDRLTRTVERVSVSSLGAESTDQSYFPSISADGRFVAFSSLATNLVAGDTNAHADVFVRDRGPQPDANDDLAVDFGGAGLWQRLDNASWQQIHAASPIAVASADLDGFLQDETIASFAGSGLWALFPHNIWTKIHNAAPSLFAAGDFDGNGSDDLAVDFGGAGLWIFYNNATWMKRHNTSPEGLAVGDLDGNGRDEMIVDFGGAGLWARYNDATWAKLNNASPVHVAIADLDGNGRDELIADFGGAGIWARTTNTSWQKLHNSASEGLAAGDLDRNGQEDLAVDFGAAGLWVRYNDTNWVKRHNGSPQRMLITDLDGNDKSELVVDFGAAGLWVRYNNTSWQKIHNASTQDLAAGGFN